MNVRLDFKCSTGSNGRAVVDRAALDLGDIYELTRQLVPAGPVAGWQAVMAAMREQRIGGIEIRGDDVEFVPA